MGTRRTEVPAYHPGRGTVSTLYLAFFTKISVDFQRDAIFFLFSSFFSDQLLNETLVKEKRIKGQRDFHQLSLICPSPMQAVLQHFKFSCKSRIKLKAGGILIPGQEIIKNVIK